ncbi:50S ribosomal protein L34e [Candidatus Woesearchaeota archaeon]|nr:50S ribosomal protein L34e [Candidatus Woesearchaeota archaeon]
MTAPKDKSTSLRKMKVRVAGGRTATHYKRKAPKAAKCGNCGAVLHGIPRARPYKMRTMAKSRKTVERPFGGNLCSRCMRAAIVEKARQ